MVMMTKIRSAQWEGKGRGEHEVPTHVIKNSELTHAACVTKNSKNARYVPHHELAKDK
jgi:hypothetical protein